jgi:ankyrin repeat protein
VPDPRLLLTVIAPDQNQGTPLHVAIQKKHSKLAVLLIQKGAEISLAPL